MNVIEIADREVSILTVCNLVDVRGAYFGGKAHCPFGVFFHSDGGMAASFRVYEETNSAYCFAGCGYFTPVSLYAKAKDLTRKESAEALLEIIDFKYLKTLDERWDAVISAEVPVDVQNLVAALDIYCSRLTDDWEYRQLDPDISAVYSQCLRLSDYVHTDEAGRKWLDVCKQAMRKVLQDGS